MVPNITYIVRIRTICASDHFLPPTGCAGIHDGPRHWLLPEEAVFLAEKGYLAVIVQHPLAHEPNAEPFHLLSLQELRDLMLQTGLSCSHYLVYSYLRNKGYVVRRHGWPWIFGPQAPHLHPPPHLSTANPKLTPLSLTNEAAYKNKPHRGFWPRKQEWLEQRTGRRPPPSTRLPAPVTVPAPPPRSWGLVYDVYDRSTAPNLSHRLQHGPQALAPAFVVVVGDLDDPPEGTSYAGLDGDVAAALPRADPDRILRVLTAGGTVCFERLMF